MCIIYNITSVRICQSSGSIGNVTAQKQSLSTFAGLNAHYTHIYFQLRSAYTRDDVSFGCQIDVILGKN